MCISLAQTNPQQDKESERLQLKHLKTKKRCFVLNPTYTYKNHKTYIRNNN